MSQDFLLFISIPVCMYVHIYLYAYMCKAYETKEVEQQERYDARRVK